MKRMKGKFGVLIILTLMALAMAHCSEADSHKEEPEDLVYLNHADTVGYVGINTCRQCHADIYDTYIETGMGSSFHKALPQNSAGNFAQLTLRDSSSGFNYHPYWKDSTLWLEEFRLLGSDTTYYQQRQIDFIVGSGQHTNSHMIWQHGYLHQAPFTWYAQKAQLDLPPGFEKGSNSRFSRKIGLECTSCHNSMPVGFIKGSVNKYRQVPGAIDCERCHGPGELHVRRMRAGRTVDTAVETDYSIVNVAKLPADLQFEVCQRCHLQGNTVLATGRSFFDFKPGMRLNQIMDVYLPRYSNAEDDFIMASHADRFRQSACLIHQPAEFNCTSCHNPHRSVKATRIESFNQVCGNCHQPAPEHECSAPAVELAANNYNCVGCHMPLSTSTDIPHVSIHDHRIQIPRKRADTATVKKFLGLAAVNNPDPDARSKALAYLQQYERFSAKEFYLDSAAYFLKLLPASAERFRIAVYYHFLRENYQAIAQLVREKGVEESLLQLDSMSYDNFDGWTAYRIGEAFSKIGSYEESGKFYLLASELMPYVPEVMNKLGSHWLNRGNKDRAEAAYRKLLDEVPNQKEALNNLGFLYLTGGQFSLAKDYFRKALAEDPDYELAWLNLASACVQLNDISTALEALDEALRINPSNTRAMALKQSLVTAL